MLKTMNAQEKELFMYVAEDATYESGDQAVFRASDFVGASVVDATNTIFRFWPQNTTRENRIAAAAFDAFQLTHTTDAHIEVMKVVANAMSNPHGGLVVVQDDLGTAFSSDGSSLGVAMSDLQWGSIASTGTAITVSAVTITGL